MNEWKPWYGDDELPQGFTPDTLVQVAFEPGTPIIGSSIKPAKEWFWGRSDGGNVMFYRIVGEEKQMNKYSKEIKKNVYVDVYDVLKAFDVRCPALQHLIKKALAAGQRGHKDLMTDLDDIIASANRAKELAE